MTMTPLEYMMAGMWVLQTISAAVSAMGKPQKESGAYLYMYKFLHQMTNSLDAAFEKKFNMVMPRVVDETISAQKTTAADGSTQSSLETHKTASAESSPVS